MFTHSLRCFGAEQSLKSKFLMQTRRRVSPFYRCISWPLCRLIIGFYRCRKCLKTACVFCVFPSTLLKGSSEESSQDACRWMLTRLLNWALAHSCSLHPCEQCTVSACSKHSCNFAFTSRISVEQRWLQEGLSGSDGRTGRISKRGHPVMLQICTSNQFRKLMFMP